MRNLLLFLSLFFFPGCNPAPPPTFSVKGKVVFPGGSLAEGTVVLQSPKRDRSVVGIIQKDHSFQLKTVLKGRQLDGVEPDTYAVEILPPPSADQNPVLLEAKTKKLIVEAKENEIVIEVIKSR